MKRTFALTTANGKPTCPELVGYELPEWNHQEEDVEGMAENSSEIQEATYTPQHKVTYKHGFIDGYHKAREKFEFSRQDLIGLVESLKDYTAESNNILGYDEREASEFVDIFLNGRTPRTPIAIEVEMVESTAYNAIRLQDETDCFGYYIPATNPDGTLKGRWVYE